MYGKITPTLEAKELFGRGDVHELVGRAETNFFV